MYKNKWVFRNGVLRPLNHMAGIPASSLALRIDNLNNLAQVHIELGNWSEAKHYAQAVLKLDPENKKASFRLSKCHSST